ncbi:MAG TPA: non-ribosomal peptide synthetase [Pseudomonadaceae bacterium]|nr:non-ribosomal peptide synthetase [Pseudomonadaceae bacterium]
MPSHNSARCLTSVFPPVLPASEPLAHILQHALATDPERTVLSYRDTRLHTRQLIAAVTRLTAALQANGVGKDSVVAVCFARTPDMLALLLALWNCGAVYLPLDPHWPLPRLRDCLALAKARLLLYQPTYSELAAQLALPQLRIDSINFQNEQTPGTRIELPTLRNNDPAYVLFTSGTSGLPKAVQITHGNLTNLLCGSLPLLGVKPGWRYLASSSLYFDPVFFELLAPLLTRGLLVFADDDSYQNPARLLALIEQEQVDVVQATPAMWQLLLLEGLGQQGPGKKDSETSDPGKNSPRNARKLPLALSCGEALPTHTARRLLACSMALWNLYGPTECTVWASGMQLTPDDLPDDTSTAPIGYPLPGYHFELLADSTAQCRELRISGKGVGSYLDREADAARFASNAEGQRSFLSGDCCAQDAKQRYHFLHRRDTQLKINGYRIEAGEIEHFLCLLPGVEQACCVAQTSTEGVSRLLAFVVCGKDMPNRDSAAWNRHLASWLPQWMLPQRYYVLDSLPLSANGKTDRKALLRLADERPSAAASEADLSPLRTEVRRIFCNILECDTIGLCDSFFDAGGNSMLSATLVMALNQQLGSQLRLSEVLATPPTVSSISKLLEAQQQS